MGKEIPKILICYGTRPEVIKVSSTIKEILKRHIPFTTVFTGQHYQLFDDVKSLVPKPDYNLEIMGDAQSPNDVLRNVAEKFTPLLKKINPDLVVVQGDTTTSATIALVSYYEKFPIGHIEAGLRTYNPMSPFPEEVNRQLISRLASIHWAPTKTAADNLKSEGIKNVLITGNTVIDVCKQYNSTPEYGDKVLVTLHRRENFGGKLVSICTQIESIAKDHPELEFVFPMHPNPEVQKYRGIFKKVTILEPLEYISFLTLLSKVKFVITDSGGIQEECAVFKKKALVCRDTTERPEGVEAGLTKVVGTSVKSNIDWANENPEWDGQNPYGDGSASIAIISSILETVELSREKKLHSNLYNIQLN